jgi:hypothetical protein
LTGSIPPDIGELSYLRHLNLEDNFIAGKFEEVYTHIRNGIQRFSTFNDTAREHPFGDRQPESPQ